MENESRDTWWTKNKPVFGAFDAKLYSFIDKEHYWIVSIMKNNTGSL